MVSISKLTWPTRKSLRSPGALSSQQAELDSSVGERTNYSFQL